MQRDVNLAHHDPDPLDAEPWWGSKKAFPYSLPTSGGAAWAGKGALEIHSSPGSNACSVPLGSVNPVLFQAYTMVLHVTQLKAAFPRVLQPRSVDGIN